MVAIHRAGAAGTTLWSGAAAPDQNWSTAGNWTSAGGSTPPAAGDSVVFGPTGTSATSSSVNSIVDLGFTSSLGSLDFTNNGAAAFHVPQIPVGQTLTVSGTVTNGGILADGALTQTFMTGGGTFLVTGTLFQVGNFGVSASAASATLDMSGLSYFVYNASAGTFNVGEGAAVTGGTANRPGAILKLAGVSNNITAATINFQTLSGGNSGLGSSSISFGAGTNIVNVGTFNLATRKNSGTVQFNATTGGLRIRGVNGNSDDTSRANISIGDVNAKTGTSQPNGKLLLAGAGHPVDIKVGTLLLGRANATSGANIGTGTVTFDAGTIDATTINMAVCSSSASSGSSASGTINVTNNATAGTSGTLIVGTGGISLVNATTVNNTCTGNLNVNGGTVISSGNIVKLTTINSVGNVTISSGTLTMAAGTTVGTLAIPIDTLTLSNSTLQLAVSFSLTNIVTTNLNAVAGANNTINISALPVLGAYPAQIPLIKYTTPSGDLTTFTLGTLPPASPVFQGYISNDVTDLRIDLVITNGPIPPPASKAVVWDGEVSGDWDTTTTNWTSAGNLTNYNNVTASGFGDTVTFDDSLLGTTNVNLTQTLSPGSITVSATTNYFFTGSGKISGAIGLTKNGSGTLTFANSTVNDFSGAIILNAGTLAYDQSVDATVANVISGAGTVVKNHANTLTLSGSSSFTGGLTVNAGAVRANAVSAPGTGLIMVSSGGTFVVGAAHTNSITLSNAVIGTSLTGGFTMATNSGLTIADNSTNVIYSTDPQSPVTSFQFLVDGVLHGSGTVICINAPTNSPDSGQGVRFRNTNAVSDFSGTIIYTNGTKGELLTLAPVGTTFSPIGTGKLILDCGLYDGGNTTTCPANGTGFCELNLRVNGSGGSGSVTMNNDLALAGTGAAIVNALSSNSVTMGKLTIGGGQELIGYKAAGTPTNTVTFTTVTLTGGTATFSPHSSTFGAAGQAGTDIILGNISEQTAGSGITMAGKGNLTLTGNNTYTGNTTISNGVLFLSNAASIATSPNIVMAAGAKFDVSSLSSTFALGAAQTLSNITSTAVINGNADVTSGTLSLTYAAGTPSFSVTGGTLTVGSGTAVKINNTGAAFTRGSYKVVSGSVAGTAPSSVTVGGNGIATAVTPSLQINGNELFLVVPDSAPAIAHIVTNSTSAGVTWKIAISSLSAAAGWSDPDNDTLTLSGVGPASNLGKSVTTDGTFVYYNAPVTSEDFFTYTITDGTLTANGTAYLESAQSAPAPATANQIVKDGNGVPTITFAGIPGRTNVVEASPDMVNWTPISTNAAGGNGLWQVVDPDATNFPSRFYRSYQPYP